MLNIDQAYVYCEQVIKHHSKTFYTTFSILPEESRKAVWAVYAFCRTVDDIVDEGEKPATKLLEFSTDFEQFLNGKYEKHNPMWVALTDVFEKYEMDVQAFRDLIKGQKMDLFINRYETMEQLLHYCYHVASTVGLMLLPILAPKKVAFLREGAIALGLGMQITNILRDVGEDLERNRIYLPKEIMSQYGLTEKDLWLKKVELPFTRVWEELALKAEKYYNEALQTIDEYPDYSRIPVKAAALLYRQILDTIRQNHYHVFNEKHYVPYQQKQAIIERL